MLKNLKYIAAVGLIAFGYTNTANAVFGMGPNRLTCTASAAAKKDPKGLAFAIRCANEVDANSIKNFATKFEATHCKPMPKDKKLAAACRSANVVNKVHAANAATKAHEAAAKVAAAKKKQHEAAMANQQKTRAAHAAAMQKQKEAAAARLAAEEEKRQAAEARANDEAVPMDDEGGEEAPMNGSGGDDASLGDADNDDVAPPACSEDDQANGLC